MSGIAHIRALLARSIKEGSDANQTARNAPDVGDVVKGKILRQLPKGKILIETAGGRLVVASGSELTEGARFTARVIAKNPELLLEWLDVVQPEGKTAQKVMPQPNLMTFVAAKLAAAGLMPTQENVHAVLKQAEILLPSASVKVELTEALEKVVVLLGRNVQPTQTNFNAALIAGEGMGGLKAVLTQVLSRLDSTAPGTARLIAQFVENVSAGSTAPMRTEEIRNLLSTLGLDLEALTARAVEESTLSGSKPFSPARRILSNLFTSLLIRVSAGDISAGTFKALEAAAKLENALFTTPRNTIESGVENRLTPSQTQLIQRHISEGLTQKGIEPSPLRTLAAVTLLESGVEPTARGVAKLIGTVKLIAPPEIRSFMQTPLAISGDTPSSRTSKDVLYNQGRTGDNSQTAKAPIGEKPNASEIPKPRGAVYSPGKVNVKNPGVEEPIRGKLVETAKPVEERSTPATKDNRSVSRRVISRLSALTVPFTRAGKPSLPGRTVPASKSGGKPAPKPTAGRTDIGKNAASSPAPEKTVLVKKYLRASLIIQRTGLPQSPETADFIIRVDDKMRGISAVLRRMEPVLFSPKPEIRVQAPLLSAVSRFGESLASVKPEPALLVRSAALLGIKVPENLIGFIKSGDIAPKQQPGVSELRGEIKLIAREAPRMLERGADPSPVLRILADLKEIVKQLEPSSPEPVAKIREAMKSTTRTLKVDPNPLNMKIIERAARLEAPLNPRNVRKIAEVVRRMVGSTGSKPGIEMIDRAIRMVTADLRISESSWRELAPADRLTPEVRPLMTTLLDFTQMPDTFREKESLVKVLEQLFSATRAKQNKKEIRIVLRQMEAPPVKAQNEDIIREASKFRSRIQNTVKGAMLELTQQLSTAKPGISEQMAALVKLATGVVERVEAMQIMNAVKEGEYQFFIPFPGTPDDRGGTFEFRKNPEAKDGCEWDLVVRVSPEPLGPVVITLNKNGKLLQGAIELEKIENVEMVRENLNAFRERLGALGYEVENLSCMPSRPSYKPVMARRGLYA